MMLIDAKGDTKKYNDLVTRFSNNKEFFSTFNAKRMPLDQYMSLHAEEFAVVAQRAKVARDNMRNRGWTDKKYQKYTAELPERLILERPEFSASLPRKQLAENIRKFLSLYPQFRVDK